MVAVAVTFFSRSVLVQLGLWPAVVTLFLILVLAITFDVIGTATLAASQPPFHAMAANRVAGAKEAIRLVKNADAVAAFCNDIVGDVLGTISGGLAANIVFRLVQIHPTLSESLLTTVAIGLVAAVSVGGKAAWKKVAVTHSTGIVLWVGKAIYLFEGLVGRNRPGGRTNKANGK